MPDRLRIALVVHDLNRHLGHSRYTAELAARFKREHEVHVFANTFDDPDPAGLILHRVPAVRSSSLASSLSFVAPGTLAVLGGGFDVIHAQGLCGVRHDITTAHFVQPGWYDAVRQAAGRLTLKQKVWNYGVGALERYALTAPGVRHVLAISDRVKADLARYYRRTRGVTTVYHGVDLDTFHPGRRAAFRDPVRDKLKVPAGAVLALFVGNVAKGAGTAIRVAAAVPGLLLAVVSASNASAEQALAKELGVAHRVRFVPATKEVERYFAAADLFLFPTLYEPFGMVISEAMATGLPVVTSRAAGAAELIRDGESGYLVNDPWDIPALAGATARLAEDADLRGRMGAAARAAVEPYTWDRTAAETLAVYRQVAAAKRSRR